MTKETNMKAYRFTTRISAEGTIQVPYSPSLFEEEVEVVILPKAKSVQTESIQTESIQTESAQSEGKAAEFVKKWRGLVTNDDPEKSKYEYLVNKYQ